MAPNRNPAARLYAPVVDRHRPQVTPPVEQGKAVVLSHIFSPPAWVGVGTWRRRLVFPLSWGAMTSARQTTLRGLGRGGSHPPGNKKRPSQWGRSFRLSKKGIYVRFCARASQSSVIRRRRNQVQSVFSGDMCLGKNTAQAANVRAKRVRCSGLHLFEKMPAFLREPVDFVDRLRPSVGRRKVFLYIGCFTCCP